MIYDEDYFTSVDRYAYFAILSPLTRFAPFTKNLILQMIHFKEVLFAKQRATSLKKNFKPESSLDIGTAGGELVKELLDRSVDAYGIDVSKYQINNLPDILKGRVILAEAGNIPFPDKQFDLVTAYHILEHIIEKDLINSLKEMSRVSKKYIILALPTQENIHAHVDPTHQSIFSYKVWTEKISVSLGEQWKIKKMSKPNRLKAFSLVLERK